MLVDSHCHLDRLDFRSLGTDLEGALAVAHQAGVTHMLCVSVELESFPAMLSSMERYNQVSVSVGVHPIERPPQEPGVETLLSFARHSRIVAIGETGLDYFHCQGDTEWQRERFRTHIRAARIARKPLIVHSREAREDTLRLMAEEHAEEVGGVMHCFTEDWEIAQRAMALNFHISFSGIVTFKNAWQLQQVAKKLPLERMLIETDSPYLTPVPHRGRSNQPAYVRYIAQYLADLRGIAFGTLAEATTQNFFELFGVEE